MAVVSSSKVATTARSAGCAGPVLLEQALEGVVDNLQTQPPGPAAQRDAMKKLERGKAGSTPTGR